MADAAALARRPGPVPAVDRAAGILLALGNGQGDASLSDLARRLRIHKSTAHGILATLARHRFVDRNPETRRYRLGPALAALGRAAVDRQDLGALARPHLVRLRRLSGETATLHLRDGSGSVILASEESANQLKVVAPPGYRLPPDAGAVAKVLRAFGPGEAGWPARLPAYTPRSVRDPARYRQELLRVRRAGVAVDDMEYLSGVRAISAPVFRGTPGRDAEAIGALSIVGVSARLSPAALRRLAGPLRDAAQALSAALAPDAGGSPPRPVRKGFRGEGRARG
ncbi:MAG: IclR family transcriptional regulator [Bacillati bacterium ANGP1]|uniref:Glycerol operon regulatory protein n=1 Tax=Candidatus Segetimicrobium genomatis TaxID=2569760 RepID=A0A537J2A7_9BACT|nr:MAG: IclR family transcriptional regulator [Terrabacteria group bacterium ANGP1]